LSLASCVPARAFAHHTTSRIAGILGGPVAGGNANASAGLLATPPPGNITMAEYMRRQQMASLAMPHLYASGGGKETGPYAAASMPLGYGAPVAVGGVSPPQMHQQPPAAPPQAQPQPAQQQPQQQARKEPVADSVRDAFRALFPATVNISFAPVGPSPPTSGGAASQSQPPAPVPVPGLPAHVPYPRDQGRSPPPLCIVPCMAADPHALWLSSQAAGVRPWERTERQFTSSRCPPSSTHRPRGARPRCCLRSRSRSRSNSRRHPKAFLPMARVEYGVHLACSRTPSFNSSNWLWYPSPS
jgi:hypothetical protein